MTESKNPRRQVLEDYEGVTIKPGIWDSDLNKYPEMRYALDIGGGFKVTILKTIMWTWNGYLIVPSEIMNTKPHDQIEQILKSLPFPISFRSYRAGIFGIDHCKIYDLSPVLGIVSEEDKNKKYTTFEETLYKLKILASRLGWYIS